MKARLMSVVAGVSVISFLLASVTLGQSVNAAGEAFPAVTLTKAVPASSIPSMVNASDTARIASWYGLSTAEFHKLAAQDKSLKADRSGRLFYACQGLVASAGTPFGDGGTVTQTNYPLSQTFLLQSRPGASRTIYLDFNGHTTSGTSWNSSYNGGSAFSTPPYDIDGNTGAFSSNELVRIQGIWKRVSEDFIAYDVNVTTIDPGIEALRKSNSSDLVYGVRVAIGGSSMDWFGASAGGVAYVGSFNWSSDTPCFVFTAQLGTGNEKYTAEAVSHEVGHTLGLRHDGTTNNVEYYAGHGNWAPIMGVGYYKEVTQWSKGEYPQANNLQDDLVVMTTYGAPLRVDDHSDVIVDATPLDGWQVRGAGVISTRQDADLFRVISAAGSVVFTATPAQPSPNLDIQLSLYDGLGNVLGAANGSGMGCTLSASVAAGVYYVAVEGVGAGSPLTSYNDYASIGEYSLSGTVVPSDLVSPTALASANVTSGQAPLAVQFSSAGSYDDDGSIVAYDWDFGDGTGSTSPNPSKTYSVAGVYHPSLVVIDDDGLASAASALTITVTNPPPPPKFVRVTSIAMAKSVKRGAVIVTATVTVKDGTGKIMPNVVVSGSWSGVYSATASGKTGSKGTVAIKTATFKGTGTETFTVNNLTLSGYVYDSSQNTETSDSIAVP